MTRHGDSGDPDPARKSAVIAGAWPLPAGLPDSTGFHSSVDPQLAAHPGAIGPAPNPANNTYLALEYYKQLVPNAEVTLPGSICEACTPREIAPNNTWLPHRACRPS